MANQKPSSVWGNINKPKQPEHQQSREEWLKDQAKKKSNPEQRKQATDEEVARIAESIRNDIKRGRPVKRDRTFVMEGALECGYGERCTNNACRLHHAWQRVYSRGDLTNDNIAHRFTPTPCDGRHCQGPWCTHAHEDDGYPMTKLQEAIAENHTLKDDLCNLRVYSNQLEAKCEDLDQRADFLSGAGLSPHELVKKRELDLANAKKALEEDETRRAVAEVAAKLAEEEAKAAAELAEEIADAKFIASYEADKAIAVAEQVAMEAKMAALLAKQAAKAEAKEAEVVP
jgi:hypothetical protein